MLLLMQLLLMHLMGHELWLAPCAHNRVTTHEEAGRPGLHRLSVHYVLSL